MPCGQNADFRLVKQLGHTIPDLLQMLMVSVSFNMSTTSYGKSLKNRGTQKYVCGIHNLIEVVCEHNHTVETGCKYGV
jgi:hypothetical protein